MTQSARIKQFTVKAMLGVLVAAAVVTVVAILIGDVNEVVWRAIGTLLSAMLHLALILMIVSVAASDDPEKQRAANLATNVSMVIVVLSFFTSILGIWEVLDGEIAGKLYVTYAVALFAVLHTKVLMDAQTTYQKVRPYVLANYAFIVIVAGLILGVVYAPEGFDLLGTFYGRLLAASAVINVTLGMIIAVMQRMYLQSHPELQKEKHSSALRIVIILVFAIFVVPALLGFLARLMAY